MATCKDCVHVEVCKEYHKMFWGSKSLVESKIDETEPENCLYFKDRSRFVELPDVGDYDTVTIIDEAIDHCYKIATSTDENVCVECKAEHMRLCGWLGDLRRRIEAEQALKERESK